MTDSSSADRLRADINTDDPTVVPGTGGIENPDSPESDDSASMMEPLTDAGRARAGESATTGVDEDVESDLDRVHGRETSE